MTAPATDLVPPPPRWWWGFRVLGLRVPEEHRAWVADHLRSDRAVRRVALLRLVPFTAWCTAFVVLALRTEGAGYAGFGGFVGAALGSTAGAVWQIGRNRRRMLKWLRTDDNGRPVAPRGLARLGNAAAVVLAAGFFVGSLLVFRAFLLAVR